MAMPRMRFTIRRLLVMIVAAALLLAGFVGIRDWQRRQARIERLRVEVLVNSLAEAQAHVMAEQAKRRNDPLVAREQERAQKLLNEQGRVLREKLSRLE